MDNPSFIPVILGLVGALVLAGCVQYGVLLALRGALSIGTRVLPSVVFKGVTVRLSTTGMSPGSLFRFLWIGTFFGLLPYTVFKIVMVALGFRVAEIDGKGFTGIAGIPVVIILWPVAALVGACILWLMFAFGFWLHSKWSKVQLEFANCEVEDSGHAEPGVGADSR